MSWINYDDVLGQITGAGIIVDGGLQIGTRAPVRCKVEGEREKRGWYRLFELALSGGDRIITGSYGVWHGDDNGATKIALPRAERTQLDPDQQAAIKARQAEDARRAAAERRAEIDRAAARALHWWSQCVEHGESPYLTRKGLPPGKLYGARLSERGNLVIPVQDGDGRIYGLQIIYADPKVRERKGRDKDFSPPGLAKQSHYAVLGAPTAGGVLLLAEGFATAASLHEATGLPVIVAFDAGNLLPVAQAILKRYKRARLLVCGDDDAMGKCSACGKLTPVDAAACAHCGQAHGKINTGRQRAEAAAAAVDGAWVLPQWPTPRPTDRKGPSDFNDLHVHPQGGLGVVRAQIEAALSTAGFAVRSAARAELANGGAGETEKSPDERPAASSIISLDAAVERFMLVDDGTGDTVFDHWTHKLAAFGHMLRLLPARVRADDIKDHPMWRQRAVYLDEIGFDPAGTDSHVKCNLWRGWPTKPKAGKCDALLGLLEHLCSGERSSESLYLWVLQWLAYPLQHPGAKMATAIVVHGPQGTGKSRFFEAVASIYADYGIVLNQGAIEDKFNADWAGQKLFVLADEIVANTEKYHLKNLLKAYITGKTIRVNPKNVAAHTEANHMNLVFLSNEKQPVVLEADDRRHCVIYTPPKLDMSYYQAIDEEIANGGIEALYYYLLHLPLDDFHPWTWPPETKAKFDLIDLSIGSDERFLRHWIAGDVPASDDSADPLPFCNAGTQQVYDAYLRWCRQQGESRPRTQAVFLSTVEKNGFKVGHADRYDDLHFNGSRKRQRMVQITAAQLADAEKRGIPVVTPRPEDSLAQYNTRCFFAFHNAQKVEP